MSLPHARVVRLLLALFGCLLACVVSATTLPEGAALDVSQHDRVALTRWTSLCSADPALTIDHIAAGQCQLQAATRANLTRGFERQTVWLRLTLENRGAQAVERMLTVGHPRIERVTLYRAVPGGHWQAEQAGTTVALAQQAQPSATPNFPVRLAAGERQTLWVSVWSRTVMNLDLELASPQQAHYRDSEISIFQAAAMGSLLLCCIFGLGWFFTLRDRASLYFAGYIAGELLTEAARTGVLRLYFWPPDKPYVVEILTVGVLMAVGFMSVFLLAYVPHLRRYRKSVWMWAAAAALYGGGVLWALVIDYRSGTWFWTWAVWLLILAIVNLLIQAARDKVQEARVVLGCAALTVCFELVRLLAILGYLPFGHQMAIMGSWTFVLSALILLLNVSQRSWQLQRTLTSAETEAEQRLRFMSSMGHELRSPLNAIVGHTQLMERGPGLETERTGLPAIRQNAEQMLSMIDEILDYSQGKNQHLRLHLRPISWGQLVDHMAQDAEALVADEPARLTVHTEGDRQAVLLLDQRRLLQVIHNLIGNAVRHAPGAPLGLRCALHKAPAPKQTADAPTYRADFEVWDAGPGIPEHDQAKVFEPFHRGHDAHLAHISGLGMGLAISRQLVRAMGAELTLTSHAAEPGCRFRFSLLLDSATAAGLNEPEPSPAPAMDEPTPSTVVAAPHPIPPGGRPNAEQTAQLLNLLDNGQVSELLDLLNQMAALPSLAAFAAAATTAVMQLNFDAVRALCCGLVPPSETLQRALYPP